MIEKNKIGIFSLHHLTLDDIDYWYNWHKELGDIKILYQTDIKCKKENVTTIDIPGNIVVPTKMRLYVHYALKYDYDYYVFCDSDCFILKKDFIHNIIKYMNDEKAETCFTQISDRPEHYKYLFYDYARKVYNINMILYSLNICTICKRSAIEIYNKKNHYKIYDEVDFTTVLTNFSTYCVYGADYHLFNAGVVDFEKIKERQISNVNETTNIIHAIKDYQILKRNGIKLT